MKRIETIGAVAIAALALTAACSSKQDPPEVSVQSELPSTPLMTALQGGVDRGEVPGAVGLVVDQDGIVFEGAVGLADAQSDEPMRSDSIFAIASMTKPITSVAAMMLVEDGLLELSAPVATYLPDFMPQPVLSNFDSARGTYDLIPAGTEVTIHHLLTHTSGIGYAFANATVALLQQEQPDAPEWELPLLNEPGARWNYSASTRLLGMVIETVTGQSLENYFQRAIFEPLGMVDTSFAVPPEKQSRLVALYGRAADETLEPSPPLFPVPEEPTAPFGGDGGLFSTARDYGQFMRMLLNGGQLEGVSLVSSSTVQQMGENQIGDLLVELQQPGLPVLSNPFPVGAGRDKFGYGFQIATESDGSSRSAGSLAWAGLFNTEFWIDPVRGIAATHLVQVLPFYDEGCLRALGAFEQAVYEAVGATARPSWRN